MNHEQDELIATLSDLIKCDPAILQDFPISLPNIKMQTMGGSVFWDDVAEIKGWRLQVNMFTGHWRLLDPYDVRHAWGTNDKMVGIFVKAAEETENGKSEVSAGHEENGDSSGEENVV